jgi:hypothetical protein
VVIPYIMDLYCFLFLYHLTMRIITMKLRISTESPTDNCAAVSLFDIQASILIVCYEWPIVGIYVAHILLIHIYALSAYVDRV